MADEAQLSDEYGSPLYVYDLDDVASAAAALRDCLPHGCVLYYSLKANPHVDVGAVLNEAGCGAEVSSAGELAAALAAGFAADQCLYTGPGKTVAELKAAVAAGVGLLSAESIADLVRIGEVATAAGMVQRCLLRINGGTVVGAGSIRMTGVASQFGMDVGDVAAWARAARTVPGVEPIGLHFFSASNVRDEDALLAEFRASIATAAALRDEHGLPVRYLDLGGGFSAPYAEPGNRTEYPRLRAGLLAALDEHFPEHREGGVLLAFESGRYLVGCSGSLVATVTDVKSVRGNQYAVLDAGINHLGGMSGLQRMMPLAGRPAMIRRDPRRQPATAPGTVVLVGPLCTPVDRLTRDFRCTPPEPSDVVVFPNVGAYGLSASLVSFLSRDRPAEVCVRGGVVVSAARERTTSVDLLTDVRRRRSPRAVAEDLLPVLRDAAVRADREAEFPVENLGALRESGLMGLLVPVRYGGLGGTLRDLADVTDELGTACMSTAMVFAMHCQQVDALVRHGDERLRTEVLPHIAAGEVYIASITSETRTGGHLLTSAAPLVCVGEQVRVKRTAPVVTGGAHADAFLVTMLDRPSAPAHEVTLVYVRRDQVSVEQSGDWDPMGMRGTHSVRLELDGTVPEYQVVGVAKRFRDVAVDSFMPLAHIGWSACWLGGARQALREVVALARSVHRPSGLDPSSELLHERLARVRQQLELVSAYLDQVVGEVERCRRDGTSVATNEVQIHLNTLKVAAAELTFDAVDRCVQVAGLGHGYLRTSPLERVFRDVRSASLNYSDDRLLKANGLLTLADRSVRLI